MFYKQHDEIQFHVELMSSYEMHSDVISFQDLFFFFATHIFILIHFDATVQKISF